MRNRHPCMLPCVLDSVSKPLSSQVSYTHDSGCFQTTSVCLKQVPQQNETCCAQGDIMITFGVPVPHPCKANDWSPTQGVWEQRDVVLAGREVSGKRQSSGSHGRAAGGAATGCVGAARHNNKKCWLRAQGRTRSTNACARSAFTVSVGNLKLTANGSST